MKLKELKAKVYELSGLGTTRQLKAEYQEIKTLDLRLKASWEKALSIVQATQKEFQEWVENPPDEYKNLFAEIEQASQTYDRKRAKVKQLGREVIGIADDLEVLSKEMQEEGARLKQDIEEARQILKQAELN